jgi:hypothetical protein
MSITPWYDVWCDDPNCIDWTPGGNTRREAAANARRNGWRRERDGWKCPNHRKRRRSEPRDA